MKLSEASQIFAKLADENPTLTFCFDECYEGNVRIVWHGVLNVQIPPKDVPRAVECIKKLEDLGIEII